MSLKHSGVNNPNWGRIFGAEVRRNMSLGLLKYYRELPGVHPRPMLGKKLSKEHRNKISKGLLEYYSNNEHWKLQNKIRIKK